MPRLYYVKDATSSGIYGGTTVDAESVEEAATLWAAKKTVEAVTKGMKCVVYEMDDGTQFDIGLNNQLGTTKTPFAKLQAEISVKKMNDLSVEVDE